MRGAVSVLVLLASAACGHAEQLNPDVGPPDLAAVYVLRSAGDAPVPAVWISNPSVTITVLADTIRLRATSG